MAKSACISPESIGFSNSKFRHPVEWCGQCPPYDWMKIVVGWALPTKARVTIHLLHAESTHD
jgi:hypothetical protein